jgi:uncharacterized protein (TIGR03435 family)
VAQLITRTFFPTACIVLVTAASFAQNPADQPAFEAASVKRSDPKATGPIAINCNGGPGSSDPGLLTCTNVALAQLAAIAYKLQFYELVSPEWMIHGGSQNGYDVVAKIPPGATQDQYRLMFQRLLAERFHLVVHRESRDMAKYALVLGKGKPKLTPSAAPSPSEPPFAQTVVNGHLRFSLRNRPLALLAKILTTQLSGPVTDETGLSGDYDITLEFMPDDRSRGFSPPAASAAAADAIPDLFIAIQDQLGLKIEARKGPVSVRVVDHADKAPVEN